MSKVVFKTGALVGAIAGATTVFVVTLIHILRYYSESSYGSLVFLGNLIIYMPLGLIGGAVVGFVFGKVITYLSRIISKGKVEAKNSSLIGGLIGGILVGLAPVLIGFVYLY
jgi:H+/Cl- antiporter ClcA